MKESYFIADPLFILREEDDEALILNPETGELKMLNELGAVIYKLCDGTHNKNDIIKAISTKFIMEETSEVEKDVDNFLQDLLEKKIIGINITK